jgi:ATP-dependent Lon protease
VFEDEALSMVVRHYTRETGVRNLEREISGNLPETGSTHA